MLTPAGMTINSFRFRTSWQSSPRSADAFRDERLAAGGQRENHLASTERNALTAARIASSAGSTGGGQQARDTVARDQRPVLENHSVEVQLDVREDLAQFGADPAGHEQHLAAFGAAMRDALEQLLGGA